MSYTSVAQLRRYFPVERPLHAELFDQPVRLNGTELIPFFGAAVEAASVTVKRGSRGVLQRAQIAGTLSGSTLGGTHLVRGSIIVASDSSLRVRYAENTDFVIDYDTGAMKRLSGGAIAEGSSVAVWYERHELFISGTDYILDADSGEIRRTSSGAIRDGEIILLDYRPVVLSVTDELLTQAALTANQQIANEIDPGGQFEADPILILAATYCALGIAAEGAAARELSRRGGSSPVAQSWMQLGERHDCRSRELLGQFRAPVVGLAAPQHT